MVAMLKDTGTPTPNAEARSRRWPLWASLATLASATVFLTLPALAGVPARLAEGCGGWIATAGALELLSAVGFVVAFKLVFAEPLSWRRSVPAALRALGASTVLPGGGFIGPSLGAWSTHRAKPSLAQLTRSTTTFVILTNAPGATVLATLGILLWLGVSSGPRQVTLTILPAVGAVGLLALVGLAGRFSGRSRSQSHRWFVVRAAAEAARAIGGGIREACALGAEGDWKLCGAIAYYAFDNAALWAAFHAFGRAPGVSVIVMGYLVGSLAGVLPLPAGLGAVDAGLFGALLLYGSPAAPTAAAVLLYRGVSLSLPVALGAIGWTCSSPGQAVPMTMTRSSRPC